MSHMCDEGAEVKKKNAALHEYAAESELVKIRSQAAQDMYQILTY